MANTSSAIKRARQTARRTAMNRPHRSRLGTQVKKLQSAIQQKDAARAEKLLPLTVSILDKSVQKGVIKKNTASRMKSRLTLGANALAASKAAENS